MYSYPDFPDQVYIELTNACNARCTICATPSMKRKRAVMSFELFRKIVDECARYRARRILPFLHGETLLVPGVLDYFRYIRMVSPESHLNLTTNGSRLDAEIAETLLQENLLDSVIVSVDGADKQTFEAIRLGLILNRSGKMFSTSSSGETNWGSDTESVGRHGDGRREQA